MGNRLEVREFSTSRRARITPGQAGMAQFGQRQWTVEPAMQWALDAITTGPAIIGNERSDMLAANDLHDLVGQLSTRSDEFRRRWGSHDVRTHGTGVRQHHHHVVGDLGLLASWAATHGAGPADTLQVPLRP